MSNAPNPTGPAAGPPEPDSAPPPLRAVIDDGEALPPPTIVASEGGSVFGRFLATSFAPAAIVDAIVAANKVLRNRPITHSSPKAKKLSWPGYNDRIAALDVDLTAKAKKDSRIGLIQKGLIGEADYRQLVRGRTLPRPQVVWRTRSGGLRLIFTATTPDPELEPWDLTARERAGVYALLFNFPGDPRWRDRIDNVELLKWTTPGGADLLTSTLSNHAHIDSWPDDRHLGRAITYSRCEDVDQEAWGQFLKSEYGMKVGERYPHTQCPIEPTSTKGNDPVSVFEDGIHCYRCRSRGDGYRSAAQLMGTLESDEPRHDPLLYTLRGWAHWTHAKLVLEALRPGHTPDILKAGYSGLLKLVHAEELSGAKGKKRATPARTALASVFNPTLRFIRSETGWLDAETHQPVPLSTAPDFADFPAVIARTTKASIMKGAGSVPGYIPVTPTVWPHPRPSRDPRFADRFPHGVVTVQRAVPSIPIDLEGSVKWAQKRFGADLYEAAWKDLGEVISLDRQLVKLLICATLLASDAPHRPVFLVLKGGTGVGKNAAVELNAGIFGGSHGDVRLQNDNDEEVRRSIGTALEQRKVLLLVDEAGKTSGFFRASKALLAISRVAPHRPLTKEETAATVRAPIVVAGSTLPAAMASMAEIDRRMPAYSPKARSRKRVVCDPHHRRACDNLLDIRVWDRLPDAHGTACSTFPQWHDGDRGAARLCDVLIADCLREVEQAHKECFEEGDEWVWDHLARKLGAFNITEFDDSHENRTAAARQLYRLWTSGRADLFHQFKRGNPRQRHYFNRAKHPSYLNARHPEVWPLVEDLGLDEQAIRDDEGRRWSAICGSIQTMNLNAVLGFDEPRLEVTIKRHTEGGDVDVGVKFAHSGKSKALDPSSPTDFPRLSEPAQSERLKTPTQTIVWTAEALAEAVATDWTIADAPAG